ncbi:hypothetical protein ACJX0J_014186, partial [Zea mays]
MAIKEQPVIADHCVFSLFFFLLTQLCHTRVIVDDNFDHLYTLTGVVFKTTLFALYARISLQALHFCQINLAGVSYYIALHLKGSNNEQPRLITSLKPVRKGTNGAVTLQGLLAATGGGLIIGLTFVVVGLLTAECSSDMAIRQLLVLPISAAAGLLGSLIDSLLGATLEFSGYCSVRKK